jgi:hypothetical protein
MHQLVPLAFLPAEFTEMQRQRLREEFERSGFTGRRPVRLPRAARRAERRAARRVEHRAPRPAGGSS